METNEETEYLKPIISDVVWKMLLCNKNPQKEYNRVDLCIIDKLDVNACAIGRTTIAITKGAINAFDEEQLKGVIAHELAHINNGDTVASMFLLVASGYFFLFTSLLKLVILLYEKISNQKKNKSVIRTVLTFFIFIFQGLMQFVLSIESRKRERQADEWAYKKGFGEGLISALYLLEKMSLGDYRNFKQKLTASHPRTTARIMWLEGMAKLNS